MEQLETKMLHQQEFSTKRKYKQNAAKSQQQKVKRRKERRKHTNMTPPNKQAWNS